ncbi:MAG TPA: iron-sulfur cluster assembly scaffold protein [Candidatus Dormibacteraeota bacterium]|nr:iron-sulfur cluster assembly scaffold protein [Candidatus Dormibacteraeota bacterium]
MQLPYQRRQRWIRVGHLAGSAPACAGPPLCHTARLFAILPAMFSAAVLDHFEHPRNAGDLADATVVVEVSNPVCGDLLRLAVRLEEGRVAAARFRTLGCVTSIACSSLLTELVTGRSLQEVDGITAERIAERLGGLEPATRHAADLARDAVAALLSRAR